MKLLLIEDSRDIIDIVAITLKLRWAEIHLITSISGKEGVSLVKRELPDIVLLDLGLPDIDGFQVLRQIRSFSDVPVVILTVRGDETDKIHGLELGADDFVVKPFSPGELLARLQALIRRSQWSERSVQIGKESSSLFTKGKLRMDFTSEEVSVNDKLLKLGPREYELLSHLVANEGKVVSTQILLEKVFPGSTDTRFIEVYIKKLNDKLENVPNEPNIVFDEDQGGYRFVI